MIPLEEKNELDVGELNLLIINIFMNRRIRILFVVVVFIFAVVACKVDSVCGNSLEFKELLKYYRNDRQKYTAAKYLIDNLAYHESYDAELYSTYCHTIDSLFNLNLSETELKYEAKKVVMSFADKVVLRPDAEMLSVDFLIHHIDSSFDIWKNTKSLQHLNFQEFCEYVLPYKCVEGQMIDDWKIYSSINWGNDTLLWQQIGLYDGSVRHTYIRVHDYLLANTNVKSFSHLDIIPVLVPEVILNAPYADCYEEAILELMYCRANEVPASVDYLPNWMDREGPHYWINILNTTRVSEAFEPLDPNETYPGYFRQNDYRMPKVYRFVYKPRDILKQAMDEGYRLPSSLSYIFVKDVTSEYCRTIDLKLKTNSYRRYQYLAVFDNYNWVPVDISINRNGKLNFSNVGVGGTYCIVADDNGTIEQCGFPFEVTNDGEVRFFKCDSKDVSDITMYRKFPMSTGVYEARQYLRGGMLLSTETRCAVGIDTICCFPDDYHLTGSCSVRGSKPCRYYILTSGDVDACDIAELWFYDAKGDLIYPEVYSSEKRKPWYVDPLRLVDNEPLTFSRIERGKDNSYVMFDFGAPVVLSKILYCRRGDGNNVIPNDLYELYYNDGSRWIFHERVLVDDISVDFHDVPLNSLLYIRCLNRGRQNRIFTYNNGVVQWH